MGVDDVAGVVHGREFVFDAEGVASLGVPFLESLRGTRTGYRKGGLVGGLSVGLGSTGGIDRTGSAPGAITVERGAFQIDARGAEDGVEEKIEAALEQAVPLILAKASKQEDKKAAMRNGRQRIGSS